MSLDEPPIEEVQQALAHTQFGNFVTPVRALPPVPNHEQDLAFVQEVRSEQAHRGVRRTALAAHNCLDPHREACDLLKAIFPGLLPEVPSLGGDSTAQTRPM